MTTESSTMSYTYPDTTQLFLAHQPCGDVTAPVQASLYPSQSSVEDLFLFLFLFLFLTILNRTDISPSHG